MKCKRIQRGTRAGLALSAALIVAALLPVAVDQRTAMASCNPGRTNNVATYWVGTGRSATMTGVRGTLENYVPYAPSFPISGAWVQLVHSSADSWVKAGWAKKNNSNPEYYLAVKYSTGVVNTYSYNVLSGSQADYSITWQLGAMSAYINQAHYATFNTSGTSPDLAQASGEIGTASNQMPGGSSSAWRLTMTGLQVRQGSWTSFSGVGFNSNSSWFGLSGLSTTSIEMWDWACTS
jgi:hypothetical protein